MWKKLRPMLPHGAILIANMYIVFFLIDRVNPAMNFIDNRLTKGLLLAMCAVGLFNGYRLLEPWLRRRRMPPAPTPRQAGYAPRQSAQDRYAAPEDRRGTNPARRDHGESDYVWDSRAGEYRRRDTSYSREDTRR